ncbi:unnamed protein product [marine sediment metagenome]|uniref:Uncharacterized protein n=1 Tax=marine sediment metagenome TaxID=412755 RepID=X0XNW3_9ZZZZ
MLLKTEERVAEGKRASLDYEDRIYKAELQSGLLKFPEQPENIRLRKMSQ